MPPNDSINRRLADLLQEPRETLDVEIKGWLDLSGNNEHRAVFAKALIALANHGGGNVIIGLEEANNGVVEAPGRPADLTGYTPDNVNSVVNRYVEPPFHCDVQIVSSPIDGSEYPIISVPGGHHFPIRSRRGGPDGRALQSNVYYVRRPGPQSEAPQTGQEWDRLIRRCISNARDDLLDQFRVLMAGGAPAVEGSESEVETVQNWFTESMSRWNDLIEELPAAHHARLQMGHYAIGYRLVSDELAPIQGAALLETLRSGVVRLSGWPPFWVPTREGISPYLQDGNVECWLGPDGHHTDPAHADFWRASPEGKFFLIRGFQEDGDDNNRTEPGESFDLTLPAWRMGEVLMHCHRMAAQFGVPTAQVVLIAEWSGLANRQLISWANPSRMLFDGHQARQDVYRTNLSVQADQIPDNLPELVDRVVRPLYELFDFFQIPANLVTEELARMRQGRL